MKDVFDSAIQKATGAWRNVGKNTAPSQAKKPDDNKPFNQDIYPYMQMFLMHFMQNRGKDNGNNQII